METVLQEHSHWMVPLYVQPVKIQLPILLTVVAQHALHVLLLPQSALQVKHQPNALPLLQYAVTPVLLFHQIPFTPVQHHVNTNACKAITDHMLMATVTHAAHISR